MGIASDYDQEYDRSEPMSKASGVVTRVPEKAGKYGPMYSILLEGDETWYGCKGRKPDCKEGDTVEFNFAINPRGYSDADVASVSVLMAGPDVPVAPPTTEAASDATPTPGRVAYDKKQIVICYQSARNAAIELITLALKAEVLDIPKKGTIADKFNSIRIFVDEATNDYHTAAMDVYTTGELPTDDDS